MSTGDVKIKHSPLSSKMLGSSFPQALLHKLPLRLSPATSFEDILADQEMLYGELSDQDKLKLLFQAVYGGKHLIKDREAAWNFLCQEWRSLDYTNDEPLAERISPEGDLYRINLRPAKELGINLTKLFEALLRSAERAAQDQERRKILLLPQVRSVGIEPDIVAVNPSWHSDSYRRRNQPAYRLIHVSEIALLLTD